MVNHFNKEKFQATAKAIAADPQTGVLPFHAKFSCNHYYALALDLATQEELDTIAKYAFKVNEVLKKIMLDANIRLVDFKLEFGRLPDGTIILADEISPDTCRFWDATTGAHLDKDLFRRNMGGEADAYQEVMKRLLG